MPCTLPGERAFNPTHSEIQQKQSANPNGKDDGGDQRCHAFVWIRKPIRVPEPEVDRAQDQVADEVGQHRADERNRPGHW